MFIKILLLVFVLSIFEVNLEDVRYEDVRYEYVSPVLKKNRTDPNRFSFAGKTYYVGGLFKTNFYKAMQFCRQLKMQLLSINNQIENDRIGKFLIDNGLSDGYFWTSGTNLGDGKWVWLSTGNNMVYTHFSPGEPNGLTPQNQSSNCIEVRHLPPHGFTWNDVPCHYDLHFICESTSDCDCNCANL